VSPLPLLKLAQALAHLKSSPRGRNGSPELLRPARGLPTAVLPCLPWIRGLFPAIEFAVAPFPSLPNSDDPGATLAHACINSSDFTATERRGAACSRLFPRSDLLRPIQIERFGPRVPLRARAPDDLTHMSAPPVAAHPSQSDSPRPILIEWLGPHQTPFVRS
jgi:hypothetical protein